MTEYHELIYNEASASKNMANEAPDSPSALNYTVGFSKTDGNQEKELAGSRRNFWQKEIENGEIPLAILIVLLLLVLILFVFSVIRVPDAGNLLS
ncbi:hypothetical protein TNCT_305381 [Trichonephila clavata]|uniref:Uncharacterized protein n=1 Tax=Trichonephila clavata TaxID=2740835 RepID=A0A8X6L225_TRICU|nr:hypothetical protein TNCT_305381 [Trichonephila clavata]